MQGMLGRDASRRDGSAYPSAPNGKSLSGLINRMQSIRTWTLGALTYGVAMATAPAISYLVVSLISLFFSGQGYFGVAQMILPSDIEFLSLFSFFMGIFVTRPLCRESQPQGKVFFWAIASAIITISCISIIAFTILYIYMFVDPQHYDIYIKSPPHMVFTYTIFLFLLTWWNLIPIYGLCGCLAHHFCRLFKLYPAASAGREGPGAGRSGG